MKLHVVAGFVALLFLSGCSNPPADPEVEIFLVNRHESTPLSEVSSIFGIKTLDGIRKDEATYTADVEYQLVADISYSDFERIHEQELERDSGSTPLLRTFLKRGTLCQRSVHVQTQKI